METLSVETLFFGTLDPFAAVLIGGTSCRERVKALYAPVQTPSGNESVKTLRDL